MAPLFNQNFLVHSWPSINRGAAWDFEDSWASDNGTAVGTKITVDTGNATLDYSSLRDGSTHLWGIDVLGATLSNTAWIYRMTDFFIDNSTGPSSSELQLMLGLYDEDTASNDGNAQDFIEFKFVRGTSSSNLRTFDGNGVNPNSGTEDSFTTSLATATSMNLEQIRDSATAYTSNWYSDTGFSSLTESQVGVVSSSTTNLRYWKAMALTAGNVNGAFDGTIDTLQLNDGVTTPP